MYLFGAMSLKILIKKEQNNQTMQCALRQKTEAHKFTKC